MKAYFIPISFMIIFMTTVCIIVFIDTCNTQTERVNSNIGKSIIIYGDTATIMSFNYKTSQYLLSTGKVVPYHEIK